MKGFFYFVTWLCADGSMGISRSFTQRRNALRFLREMTPKDRPSDAAAVLHYGDLSSASRIMRGE